MIKKDNPRAKFIFALRDPIARAWSDYRFNFDCRSWVRCAPSLPSILPPSLLPPSLASPGDLSYSPGFSPSLSPSLTSIPSSPP